MKDLATIFFIMITGGYLLLRRSRFGIAFGDVVFECSRQLPSFIFSVIYHALGRDHSLTHTILWAQGRNLHTLRSIGLAVLLWGVDEFEIACLIRGNLLEFEDEDPRLRRRQSIWRMIQRVTVPTRRRLISAIQIGR